MLNKKTFLSSLLFSGVFLVGCTEALSIPTVSVRSDGNTLAFLTQSDTENTLSLQTLNIADGVAQPVAESANFQGAFDWNDATQTLVYAEFADSNAASIQVADLETGEVERLLTLEPNLWVNQLSISPDGQIIALSGNYISLWATPADLLDPTVDVEALSGLIMVVNAEDGNVIHVIAERTGDTPSLAWNPSSTRLAYAFDGKTFVYDTASNSVAEVNWLEDQLLRSPSWLDDDTIVMVSAIEEENGGTTQPEIMLFDVSNSASRSWTTNNGVVMVSASPDGSQIAYVEGQSSPDPNAQDQGYASATTSVIVIDVATDERQVVFTGQSIDKPVWSPDGQTLYLTNGNVFSMFAGNARQLYAVNVATGETTLLFEGNLATSSLIPWAPPEE